MNTKNNFWWKEEMAKLSPADREEIQSDIDAELLKMDLRELRESLGITQTRLAEILESTQGEVSKLERRGDHRISTIRKVVEALGGTMEIRCSVGDKQVSLKARQ